MGLLGFLVQGFGWRVGREIAEEAIDEVRANEDAPAPGPTEAEVRNAQRKSKRQAKREARQRENEEKRQAAAFEREFEALKRKVAR